MKHFIGILILAIVFQSCSSEPDTNKYPVQPVDWESRIAKTTDFSGFFHGKTYLPVYSHIYHIHDERTFDLTVTVSIRNVSPTDTVYIKKADYYNTTGKNIRRYLKKPVYVLPLETLEIVIDEKDIDGGSGANFLFDWAMRKEVNPPLFEAVMISTHGQQGLSFTTLGERVFDN